MALISQAIHTRTKEETNRENHHDSGLSQQLFFSTAVHGIEFIRNKTSRYEQKLPFRNTF